MNKHIRLYSMVHEDVTHIIHLYIGRENYRHVINTQIRILGCYLCRSWEAG